MSHALHPPPPDLAAALSSVGDLRPIGSRVEFHPSVGSTNDRAAALAADPHAEGTVVIADAQTSGRGRRGRVWFSPPGAGLYVSVVLAPGRSRIPVRAVGLVTLAAGVALAEGVERAVGLRAEIKWPNDLLVGGRKLAGILAEAISTSADAGVPSAPRVVVGFGVNVAPAAYPPELGERATSLERELGRSVDRGVVCAHLLAALAARYDDLLAGRFDAILTNWRERSPGSQGRCVSWDEGGEPRTGLTAGIDDDGALIVHTGHAVARIVAGDVTWA